MADKTVALNMRVTPDFKRLLTVAAAHEGRSKTNLLETLLLDYCRQRGFVVSPPVAPAPRSTRRG